MAEYGQNLWCPFCGGEIPTKFRQGEYPGALSRFDNRTEICSDCGTAEALWPHFVVIGNDKAIEIIENNDIASWVKHTIQALPQIARLHEGITADEEEDDS